MNPTGNSNSKVKCVRLLMLLIPAINHSNTYINFRFQLILSIVMEAAQHRDPFSARTTFALLSILFSR